MRILGVSALHHDAALTVIEDGEILFAAHAERYSRVKNDPNLNHAIVAEALSYGRPDVIAWYESPWLKRLSYVSMGRYRRAWDYRPRDYLSSFGLRDIPIEYVGHHLSHAAASYFTSGERDAYCLVVDAIGEFDTLTAWRISDGDFKKISSISYPDSLGLLYSAFTKRVGLRPNEDEYVLMGMAAYGLPNYRKNIFRDILRINVHDDISDLFSLRFNVHRGIGDWLPNARDEDLACSIQDITEKLLVAAAMKLVGNDQLPLLLSGGVALNCVANTKIARAVKPRRVWIMPNPGDAGSSLGAAAYVYGKQLNWKGPYLGTNIDRELDIDAVVDTLLTKRIAAVANGRAEFGPRALGNRSLLADPRGKDVKDLVNNIKKRQKFRPFAPIVLEEHASSLFQLPFRETPYMQYAVKCLMPKRYPAIVHRDGTSRVQTIREDQNPVIHSVIQRFYERTGCPMLLNTSLNIRGEPLVNDWKDALRFKNLNNVEVF